MVRSASRAYLGRRSAARVQAGALRRGTGETIRAALLCADLRDFTALSEVTEPAAVITVLDAWFDRIAGPVHAFGGEVLKFIGDGVLAIFPVAGGAPVARARLPCLHRLHPPGCVSGSSPTVRPSGENLALGSIGNW